MLVAESRRRAMKGSDRLLELELKSRLPKIYRDTVRQEVSGPEGGPQEVHTTATLKINDARNRPDDL